MSASYLEARQLISNALDIPLNSIKVESSIDNLEAWDSIGHMRIVLDIEQSIGHELEAEQVLALECVQDVKRLLDFSGEAGLGKGKT